jgi:hypothetical protein
MATTKRVKKLVSMEADVLVEFERQVAAHRRTNKQVIADLVMHRYGGHEVEEFLLVEMKRTGKPKEDVITAILTQAMDASIPANEKVAHAKNRIEVGRKYAKRTNSGER